MANRCNLYLKDGTEIATDKAIGNRRFPNNQINHLGTDYEIVGVKRPDLIIPGPGNPNSWDLIVRFKVVPVA